MKLSVLLITYNHERFIRQALESVLEQSVNFGYEIVVAEDCSTDLTRDIVTEFYDNNPDRIVPLFRTRNLGGGRNVNESLESCRGEYIAVLEGDDYWVCAGKLQTQVDFLDQNPDYSVCAHRVQVRDETEAGKGGLFPPQDYKAGPYTVEDIIANNFIATCTVVYRSHAVRPAPNWIADITIGDWARHILAASCGKIYLLDEVMAVYRVHAGGIWTSKTRIHQNLEIVDMLSAVDQHLQRRYHKAIQRKIGMQYYEMAIAERGNGHRLASARYLAACLKTRGFRLPGRWVDWASLLGYCFFGIKRFRPWNHRAA